MQELKRLVKIIDSGSTKGITIFDHSDQTSLEARLYNFIKSNKDLTDEEACSHLYGEKRLTPSYRMLKSRLRKRLLNSLLFTQLSERYVRKSYILHAECLSLVQQAVKLVDLGEILIAEKIADQIIGIARKAELNDMMAKAYEIKQHADLLSDNRARFESNFKLLQHYYALEAKEREAFLVYNKIKFENNSNISNYRKQSQSYQESLPLLKKLWDKSGSSKIFDYYHLMRIAYYELLGNYEDILNAIEEAEHLLIEGSINELWFNKRFNTYIKVYAYLRLGKLDDGLLHSEQHIGSYQKGSNNWFAFLENYVILAIYKKNYKLAAQLSDIAISNGALDSMINWIRERWGVLLRYSKLFIDKNDNLASKFPGKADIGTTTLSKDKEGFNLVLLILEYLESLPKLDQEDMEQYTARFSKYSSKYLKDEATVRARLFIKLLLLSMKEEGDKLEKKSAPVLEKLKSTPPPRDPIAEIEIVPYEHLWELTLNLMKQRIRQ